MPDDPDPDQSFSSGGEDTGGQSAPSFAPDHDSDQAQPRPGEGDRVVRPEDIRKQYDEVHNGLNSILNQQRINQNDYYVFQKQLQDIKEEAMKREAMKPPTPYALPAPPDQSQKNNIAVLATNVLKIGALIGTAYGLTQRSPMRRDLFKLGLASALEGYYSGDHYSRDKVLSIWEKNRQFIMDENRLQHQQYVDTVNTQNTTLRQKFDILSKQAQMWASQRMQDAALRADMMAVQKTLDDEMKMQRDFETQIRRDRKDWYKHMGLEGWEGVKYANWIKNQGGPDITKFLEAENSGAGLSDEEKDQMHQIESRYPRDKMLEQEQAAKDKREEEKKAKEGEAASERAFELHKREKMFDQQLQEGSTPGAPDPNAPISDDKLKEMMDKVFSAGE